MSSSSKQKKTKLLVKITNSSTSSHTGYPSAYFISSPLFYYYG